LGVKREVKRAQAAAAEHGEHPGELREDFGACTRRIERGRAAANFLLANAMSVQLVQVDRGVMDKRGTGRVV
jgi:hypothetical protein